jgi:hypothetical protein
VPSASDDPDALKLHVSPLHADVNDATGGALTVTVWTAWLVAAALSVTVSVTVYVPPAA